MIRQKSGRFYFGPNNNGNKNVERLFLVKGITLHFFFSSKFTLKNPQCNNTLENCKYLLQRKMDAWVAVSIDSAVYIYTPR